MYYYLFMLLPGFGTRLCDWAPRARRPGLAVGVLLLCCACHSHSLSSCVMALQEALDKVHSLAGVTNYLVIDDSGVPLRWKGWEAESDAGEAAVHAAALFSEFSRKAQQHTSSLLGAAEPLESVRLHTDTCEIIVAPGPGCTLIVYQASSDGATKA